MGWILEVGIGRVLRGDICKSDFFLNLFWIFSDFFLVEFYSWEFSWTSGWIPEVGIERVLRSDIWGSGHLPLASRQHLFPPWAGLCLFFPNFSTEDILIKLQQPAGHLFYSLFVFPHPAKLLPTCPNYAFCFFQLFLPIILLKSKRNIRQPRPKPNSQFEAKTINSQTRKNTADIKIVMYHNFTILSETCRNLFIILIVFPFHDFNNFSVSAQQRIQEGKEVRLKHLLPVLPEADPGVQGGLRHHRQRQGWHHHCPRPKKGLWGELWRYQKFHKCKISPQLVHNHRPGFSRLHGNHGLLVMPKKVSFSWTPTSTLAR